MYDFTSLFISAEDYLALVDKRWIGAYQRLIQAGVNLFMG